MSIQAGIYQHHHGNLYRVVGNTTHFATGEELVVYRQTTGANRFKLYNVASSMWDDIVNTKGEVDEKGKPRFRFVSL